MPPRQRSFRRVTEAPSDKTRDIALEQKMDRVSQEQEQKKRDAEYEKQQIQSYRQSHPEAKVKTDEQVKQAIQQERLVAESTKKQGVISQGKTPEEEAQAERARELAELHNNFFLGQLTAPHIDPDFAAANPEYMESVTHQNATLLPTAIASGAMMGPSNPTTVGGLMSQAASAMKSPQFWANTSLVGVPTGMAMYDIAETDLTLRM